MLARLKNWAKNIKSDVIALYFCARDPRVPWYAKAVAVLVVAYALSPIDLIPDFIPVIGYLDDIILIPLGLLLVIKLIPPDIFQEHRIAAATRDIGRPVSKLGAIVVIFIWLLAIALAVQLIDFKALLRLD